ncbi:non-ribosomal peptide synthetase, partial [Pedobacter psychrotolerans]|uniref:non-ribosomal peptide synthetase n=1 Tax=Pedobacter psychrotolerans TaxID=1843235 RepID=UPI00166A1225
LGHFQSLVSAVLAAPDMRLSDLEYLSGAERNQLLNEFNATSGTYPKDKTIVDLFEAQVVLTPDAIALSFEKEKLTYTELNERANQLAHYLNSQGVSTDKLVGVFIERSLEMIIAILGVWKTGGAYVPIDPGYPVERIDYLLEDSGVSIIVTSKRCKQNLPADLQQTVISLDEETQLTNQPVIALENIISSHGLCYVIYTSGSTGRPKGVLVEHRGMLNHLFAKINELQIDNYTRLAYTASYTFDISVWQMFCALLCGGCTIVYPDHLILQPAAMIEQIEADKVTILELVPSYLVAVLQEEIAAKLKNLRYLLLTGETVSQVLLAQWFSHPDYGKIPVVNAYGPTEASDDITHHFMYSTPVSSNVPLGKPIQHTNIYILDAYKQLCPLGIPGEICVSGVGVSRGYMKREELTKEKFVTDPFHADQRMYKTGDIGRWLKDGNIEYLGRIDDQVKIRGYRIELGEIEYVLNHHPQI